VTQQDTMAHLTGYNPRLNRVPLVLGLILAVFFPAFLSEAQDAPIAPITRVLPKLGGLPLPAELKNRLEKEIADLVDPMWEISSHEHSADAEVLVKAVEFALRHDEFYHEKHFALADKFLGLARERHREIEENEAHPWTKQTGRVIRGYRSAIDKSCQPYGLEIPPQLDLSKPVPLVVWLHGRGDAATDLHFLNDCATKSQILGGFIKDQQEAIILHPFGRQCVGWKHAGEIDVFEAIAAVKKDYPIDPQRIVLAGFSMGGAGAWHLGAHYGEKFCAVAPGAGFAETAIYNKLKPENFPPPNEQILWGLYDVPKYRRNFLNVPLLAYSGETDTQKASADFMAVELLQEGHTLRHVIGKGMGHKYDESSAQEIWSWMRESWLKGNPTDPETIHFQTRTLRYATWKWLKVTGLEKHWADTRVDGKWDAPQSRITLTTENVSSLDLQTPAGKDIGNFRVEINGLELRSQSPGFPVNSLSLIKKGPKWEWGEPVGIRKKPGVQGPIDDAFMNRFVVVPPKIETIQSTKLARWVDFELNHFRSRWSELMRGKLLEEKPSGLDSRDIEGGNLILFGDPWSNQMIGEIVSRLPIKWEKENFEFRGKSYATANHIPVFIYPNPLSPDRYIVINSGLTFRENHDRTNSQQNPKLPDWAVINLDQDPDGNAPGKVVDSGFFNEIWD
jgi:poly(3-hydroxybutyrate) depolymerase